MPLVKVHAALEFLVEVPEIAWENRWGEEGDDLTRDLVADRMARLLQSGCEEVTCGGDLSRRANLWSQDHFRFGCHLTPERLDR